MENKEKMTASLIPTWLQEFEKEAGYMGEQKKLDSPKLKEKIRELEFKVPVRMDNGEIEARYIHLEDKGIDKIIALIPDIEQIDAMLVEARKQEGKRITKDIHSIEFESNSATDFLNKTLYYLKALKKGKYSSKNTK